MERILISDGSAWPWPCGFYSDEEGLVWELRYGNAEKVRYQAAEVVEAYAAMMTG